MLFLVEVVIAFAILVFCVGRLMKIDGLEWLFCCHAYIANEICIAKWCQFRDRRENAAAAAAADPENGAAKPYTDMDNTNASSLSTGI